MTTKWLLIMIIFSIHLSLYEQQMLLFESSIHLTQFGNGFQPMNSIELIDISSNTQSILRCAMKCNQNRQCRTFDYDQLLLVCRLFEGEFSTGTILSNSILSASRIGAILYNTTATQFYSLYNQKCEYCDAGVNRYLQCINNTCQCPSNTYWDGKVCFNQLYYGSNCNCTSSCCRQDLNLTCAIQTNTCILTEVAGILQLLLVKMRILIYLNV
jgi:hypothetical protein